MEPDMCISDGTIMWYICHICHRGFNNRSEFFQHKHDDVRIHEHQLGFLEKHIMDKDTELCKVKSEFGIGSMLNIKNEKNEQLSTLEPCLFNLEPVPYLPKLEENQWSSYSCEEPRDIPVPVPLKPSEEKILPSPVQPRSTRSSTGKLKSQNRKQSIPSNPKSVQCEECEKWFASVYTLKTHSGIHKGERRFKCEQCGKKFAQKINLVYHRRTHTGEKPYECKLCAMTFAQVANFRTHLGKYHRTNKPSESKSAAKKSKS